MSDWLSPLNRLRWLHAFKAKAPQLTLDDGRVFNIDYERREQHGEVLVTPANSKVLFPRGWFNYNKVTSAYWLDMK